MYDYEDEDSGDGEWFPLLRGALSDDPDEEEPLMLRRLSETRGQGEANTVKFCHWA